MRIVMIVLILLLASLMFGFAVLNAESVKIHYYFAMYSLPLSLLLLITFVIGLLIGLLLNLPVYCRLKREAWQLRERMKLVEKEVANLRAIPLKNEH